MPEDTGDPDQSAAQTAQALERERLLSGLRDRLFEDSAALLGDCRAAIGEGLQEELHRTAHTLRGMLANMEAIGTAQAAARLEEAGDGGDLQEAAALLPEVKRFVEEARVAVAAWYGDAP